MGKPRHEQANALALANKKLVCRGKGKISSRDADTSSTVIKSPMPY